jgi:hypothetical protein
VWRRLHGDRVETRRPLPSAPEVSEDGEDAPIVFGCRFDSELGEGASDVRLDRFRAEPERAADALVRATLGDQGEDLPLARRELLERVGLSASREGLLDDGPVDDALYTVSSSC